MPKFAISRRVDNGAKFKDCRASNFQTLTFRRNRFWIFGFLTDFRCQFLNGFSVDCLFVFKFISCLSSALICWVSALFVLITSRFVASLSRIVIRWFLVFRWPISASLLMGISISCVIVLRCWVLCFNWLLLVFLFVSR